MFEYFESYITQFQAKSAVQAEDRLEPGVKATGGALRGKVEGGAQRDQAGEGVERQPRCFRLTLHVSEPKVSSKVS